MSSSITRRAFAGSAAALSLSQSLLARKPVPVGIELYSVRDELSKDLMGTVTKVAKMGYEVMEFYSPYYDWTPDYAKQVRKLLDDLGARCLSTHTPPNALTSEGIKKAIELNQIIGSKTVVVAGAGRVTSLDGWKGVADRLSQASATLKPLGMRSGFHNHKNEFIALEGKRPMEVLAANTPKDVTLQLDVGTCVEAGMDPVLWIKSNPGRIRSLHLKDWTAGTSPDKGYRVLFGEGDCPWMNIFKAAEGKGGVEYYLIEQEGSRYSPMETAQRCLHSYKRMRA